MKTLGEFIKSDEFLVAENYPAYEPGKSISPGRFYLVASVNLCDDLTGSLKGIWKGLRTWYVFRTGPELKGAMIYCSYSKGRPFLDTVEACEEETRRLINSPPNGGAWLKTDDRATMNGWPNAGGCQPICELDPDNGLLPKFYVESQINTAFPGTDFKLP